MQLNVYSRFLFVTQTLTILYLARNEIDTEGARYLADALQSNTVRQYFYSLISSPPSLFDTDTHNIVSRLE